MNGILMALAMTGGDWVIWGLAAASIWAGAAVYERWKLLEAETKALRGLRAPMLSAIDDADAGAAEKAVRAHPGAAARALGEALSKPEHAPDRLAAALADEKRGLEQRLLWLGTLGNNAPFVGLFGTVLGVIKAFRDLSQSGAGPEVVMAGLSEALIATAVGLLVAIPCVLAFNYFQKQVKELVGETEALGRRLLPVLAKRR